MPPVTVNVDWNKYEVALLIEAYLMYKEGSQSRKELISSLSKRLREAPIKSGMCISDTFRNENGISLQMNAIQNAFGDGEFGNPSKLFHQVVSTYKNDKKVFDYMLKLANAMYPLVDSEEDSASSHNGRSIYNMYVKDKIVESPSLRYVNSKVKTILEQHFPNGYRLSSSIEARRFRNFYKQTYGYELNLSNEAIDKDIKACGITYENRVYLPELMLAEKAKKDIIKRINKSLNSSRPFVYYSVLLKEFHDTFLDSKIYDAQMLREYLEAINTDGWHFKHDYLTNSQEREPDVVNEVVKYIKKAERVVTEEEVVSVLSFFPEDTVKRVFNHRDIGLINNGRKEWLHIDNFELSTDELLCIKKILTDEIKKRRYILFSELLNDIMNLQPQIMENNAIFSEIALRKVLVYKLKNKFSFKGNIISRLNDNLTADDLFSILSEREEYKLDDAKQLAEACNTALNSYIGKLLNNSCRLSENLFISNRLLSFDTDKTDESIGKLCSGDYLPLSKFDLLSSLPECGHTWTSFLLESYVYNHSKVFKLVQSGTFNQSKPSGAIVRRNSSITSYVDLAVRTICDEDIKLSEKEALEFFCEIGYIARKVTNEELSKILMAARLQKNK